MYAKFKNSFLTFITFFLLLSCSIGGDDVDKKTLASEIVGSYKVTYGSHAFLGTTDVTVIATSDDEIEITPNSVTGHPAFKAKVLKTNDSQVYGLTIPSQTTAKGTIEGRIPSGAVFSGVYKLADKSLVYGVNLTSNGVVEEISMLSNEKVDGTPTCTDGVKNGDETDVDCGGSCTACAAAGANALTAIKTASGEQFWSTGFFDDKIGIIAANATVNSSLYKTSDGGKTWTAIAAPTQSIIRHVIFTSATTVYLNSESEVYFSDNAGSSWTKITTIPQPLLGGGLFYRITDQNWVIGSDYNKMKYSLDAGATWSDAAFDKTNIPAGVSLFPRNVTHFPTTTIGYTAFIDGSTAKCHLFKTTDSGKSWTYVSQPVSKSINGIYFTNENTGFLTGEFNEILKTTDGGKTWSIAVDMGSSSAAGIYMNGNTGIASAGNKPFYTIDGGSSWKPLDAAAVVFTGFRQITGAGTNAYAVNESTAVKIDLTKLK